MRGHDNVVAAKQPRRGHYYNEGLTPRQIEWARQHDWFMYLTLDGHGIQARDYDPVFDAAGNVSYLETVVTFYNFAELRAWAGY